MAYEFKPNPFETPEADKAANLARVKAQRDALDEIRGYGSDGVVVDAVSEFGLKAMDASEKAAEGFTNAASDLGTLAVTAPSVIKEKRAGRHNSETSGTLYPNPVVRVGKGTSVIATSKATVRDSRIAKS
jgi:hypothetical protein